MNNYIILNQKQMEKIGEIASLFKTIERFKIEVLTAYENPTKSKEIG